ncbi:MAG TPA: NAD(P)/FAD-dependent oxidoreductase [Methanomassiliicoccales archaeon]|jgi:digeranylgeranylglycerophospholipid reductase|nr:NAD(P)/FAD-dependent oxidoreductase [Methanomassiliicoccales archaeon]MCE5260548.1 NAD(P)/FAD-dependent oxidoreductase [Euryarchaeota archaeon]HOE52039.1 NAD(P)/FAD-dependent oxidoreductase [Methanomassiliicoccales archaeon]HQM66534.1 NAD(P)/FAD-dependent oxidoreductase [Methanomassiliicoccales archaeon]
MSPDYDVIVVGAGPAGSMTAKHAAKKGARVLMIEKRQEIGASLRCAEGVNRKGLEKAGVEVDRRWVAAEIAGAKLVSPGGKVFRIDESQAGNEVGMVLERHLFDKALAADAARAGAEIWLKTAAVGVLKEGDRVIGVKAMREGEPVKLTAGCVVGADGFESQVARWAGIDTSLKTGDITTCYQYRMANLRTEPDYCEFILGSAAPGGYIWIFPKGDDTANVGIGVLASKLKKAGEVKRYLDAWIKKDERLSCGQPLEAVAGGVSVSPPVERSVMSGLMLVGDAARIIDPITGGGIANGLLSGKYAGEVLGDCAQANDYSEQALMPYDKRWRDSMENRLWRNWMAKEKFLTLSDQTLDGVIETLSTANVDKMSVHNILRAIKDRHPDLVKEFEDLI